MLPMRVGARHSGFLRAGRPFCGAAFGLGLLFLAASVGCNSGGSHEGATQQVARAEHSADGSGFRNLGKRSAFHYGSVQPGAAAQH